MKRLIDEKRKQFKANLHCHSNLSDGEWTPEKIKEEYKKRGYSVLCITDHEHLIDHSDLNDENILFLTGYEYYIRDRLPFDHMVGVQTHMNFYSKTPKNKMVHYTPNMTKYIPKKELKALEYHRFVENREYTVEFVRQTVEEAKKAGFLVCHNHPTWSFENESFAPAFDGCFAMEIYNHSCYVSGHNEHNQHFYDYQLRRGLRQGLIASDDNHDKHPLGSTKNDSFGGVTYILADRLDYPSIIKALEEKNFYASTGPQIFSLTVKRKEVTVASSPASSIAFVTNTRNRAREIAKDGESISQATFTLGEKDEWVRVEVQDNRGKIAFTRAYFKDEWK